MMRLVCYDSKDWEKNVNWEMFPSFWNRGQKWGASRKDDDFFAFVAFLIHHQLSHGNTFGDVGNRPVRTSTPVSVTYITQNYTHHLLQHFLFRLKMRIQQESNSKDINIERRDNARDVHFYQECVFKLSTSFAISSNGSPPIRPHPITPYPCGLQN